MEALTLIGVLAAIVGIVAGIFQILDYVQKQRGQLNALPSHHDALEILHNLPPRSEFIGRFNEKARIHQALLSRSFLISIDGIGGIGKTSLALEVAYESLEASRCEQGEKISKFSGFVWATAKDRDLTANILLDTIARTLEYPGIAQQVFSEKRYAIRKLLQQKSYLLLVDNFETIMDEGVYEFLLDLPEPSKAILTTREQKLRQVWAISLRGLAEQEALTLIHAEAKRLNLAAIDHADERVRLQIYAATGGAPLAIKWAIGQMKQKGQSLDGVLEYLHDAKGNIFDIMFARSWELLSEDSRRVLIILPVFPASTTPAAIEATSEVRHFSLDEALGQLVEMSLLDATDELQSDRRFSPHPLTRAFANAKLHETPDLEQTARNRMADYYLVEVPRWLSGGSKDYGTLEREKDNVLAVVEWCYEHRWEQGKDLALSLKWFLWERGLWQEKAQIYQKGFEVAQTRKEGVYVGRYACEVGWVYCRQGDFVKARGWIEKANSGFSEATPRHADIASLKSLLGLIERAEGDIGKAEELLQEALVELEKEGEIGLEALRVMSYLGELACDQKDYSKAREWFSKTLARARESNEEAAICWSLGNLGEIAVRSGDYSIGRDLLQKGLDMALLLSRRHTIAACTYWLGVLDEAVGKNDEANQKFAKAQDDFERLGIRKMAETARMSLARTRRQSIRK
jgi:tetratricopeptide (TPR) repeat protein